ncbi:MAG: hypothetical protein EA384_04075 [Spirochaetaceae bacterium]|nr:MAG: hypothetical protein EA384_04075 [Spirochaetaceae bacterium]
MDHTVSAVLVRVTPIILLMGAGIVVRRVRLIGEKSVEDLKKLVVNLALPAVLFRAFLDMDLDWSHGWIFVTVLAICVALWYYGRAAQRVLRLPQDYFPFLTTGFEFGMLGITLFGAAYGMQYVGYIAVVDLSHELFIWFVLVTLLIRKRDGNSSFSATAGSFLRSPVIIGIIAGLLLNLSGARQAVAAAAAGRAVLDTLELLGAMLVPAILLIIGYGLRINLANVREAGLSVVLRLAGLVPMALFAVLVVVRTWLRLPLPFERAMVTFLLLPPPYIIPLFMKTSDSRGKEYVHSVLSLYTVITVLLFISYFLTSPTI